MGIHVLAVFKPHEGKDDELVEVLRDHLPLLRRLGLATERPSLVLRAGDGTLIEHFEWVDQAAIDAAHQHPEVQQLWTRYEACCSYASLGSLPEADALFPGFAYVGSW
jgi:quinol monooxygenase YgiN